MSSPAATKYDEKTLRKESALMSFPLTEIKRAECVRPVLSFNKSVGREDLRYFLSHSIADSYNGTIRSLEPLPKRRTIPFCKSICSSLSVATSEIRAPVAYKNSRNALSLRPTAVEVSHDSRSLFTSESVMVCGRLRGARGLLSARAGSVAISFSRCIHL